MIAGLSLAAGLGALSLMTRLAGPSNLLVFGTALVVASAPLLFRSRFLGRVSSASFYFGESRAIRIAACGGAWVVGALLSVCLFI